MEPYYSDEHVTLYHGDCRQISDWITADVLVTDPPYGRGWRQGHSKARGLASDRHAGIEGDHSTELRDHALAMWCGRRAIVFGDLVLAPPNLTQQVLIYRKPPNAGTRGATGIFRRDVEAIYLLGGWPSGLTATRSSVIATASPTQGNPSSPQGRYGHPHAKPLDVMEDLIALAAATGTVADPFAGSGTTLVAARRLGRRAIGVEIDERYCEIAARRLDQGVLDFEGATP